MQRSGFSAVSRFVTVLAVLGFVTSSHAEILWSAGMETGDMSEWYIGSGGGEFNSGNSDSRATTEQARTGQYSAKLTARTPPTAGVRLFRWDEGTNADALYYSNWFYFPQAYNTPSGWWNIFQWKSSRSGREDSDPFFILSVDGSGGDMTFFLFDWQKRISYFPSFRAPIPIGRWFHIEAYQTCTGGSSDQVKMWMEDVLLFEIQAVQTKDPGGTCGWSINNYSDHLSPSPTVIYVDDAAISTTRIGAGSGTPSPRGQSAALENPAPVVSGSAKRVGTIGLSTRSCAWLSTR